MRFFSAIRLPEIEVALIICNFLTEQRTEKNSLQLSLIITPQVNMVAGQAHAPVFKAKLSVCEGLVVTATGSSKKIAKNLAAAEMLQKLTNTSPELEASRQDKTIQKGCSGGGGEALHQLVNISRDKLVECFSWRPLPRSRTLCRQ